MAHTKTIAIALGVLLAGSLASQAAFAQDSSTPQDSSMQSGSMQNKSMMHSKTGHADMMKTWDAMDTDKDGFISRSEHAAYWDSMFTKADSNGDGKISKEEMQSAMKMMHH
jgi:hypothetical protein